MNNFNIGTYCRHCNEKLKQTPSGWQRSNNSPYSSAAECPRNDGGPHEPR